jgi:hypothetical protein
VLGGFDRVEVVEMGGLGVGDMAADFGGSLLIVDTAGLTVEAVVVDGAKE